MSRPVADGGWSKNDYYYYRMGVVSTTHKRSLGAALLAGWWFGETNTRHATAIIRIPGSRGSAIGDGSSFWLMWAVRENPRKASLNGMTFMTRRGGKRGAGLQIIRH
jgi:hypothetical protein